VGQTQFLAILHPQVVVAVEIQLLLQ